MSEPSSLTSSRHTSGVMYAKAGRAWPLPPPHMRPRSVEEDAQSIASTVPGDFQVLDERDSKIDALRLHVNALIQHTRQLYGEAQEVIAVKSHVAALYLELKEKEVLQEYLQEHPELVPSNPPNRVVKGTGVLGRLLGKSKNLEDETKTKEARTKKLLEGFKMSSEWTNVVLTGLLHISEPQVMRLFETVLRNGASKETRARLYVGCLILERSPTRDALLESLAENCDFDILPTAIAKFHLQYEL